MTTNIVFLIKGNELGFLQRRGDLLVKVLLFEVTHRDCSVAQGTVKLIHGVVFECSTVT